MRELASLQTGLPLHPSSSIFLRVDESRTDVLQALITGPLGTPYGGGCFQFDIYLDQNYPSGSPKVNLETTGNGSVRFNPNLYNCGKVCLSLLGTWQGASNESWDENTSTLLQVLVSIQSLILVTEPYFNEPGYESRYDESSSKAKSARYSRNIRVETVRWALTNQIATPSEGFEKAIHTHIAVAKQLILDQIGSWLDEPEDEMRPALLDAAARFVYALKEKLPPIEGAPTEPLKIHKDIQDHLDKAGLNDSNYLQFDGDVNTDIYSF